MNDYEKGYAQFAGMVGEENMAKLAARFKSVCPDFEHEVISVVGGRIWTRGGIDLKTRSLCSISVLAALGRNNALKLNLEMALHNGVRVEEIYEALFQVAAYAGFAAAWDGLEKLGEVLKERKGQPDRPVQGRSSPQNVGEPWTAEEERQLISDYDAGRSIKELSERHKRTTGGIRARLIKLGKISP